jgi:hypothetical protein
VRRWLATASRLFEESVVLPAELEPARESRAPRDSGVVATHLTEREDRHAVASTVGGDGVVATQTKGRPTN